MVNGINGTAGHGSVNGRYCQVGHSSLLIHFGQELQYANSLLLDILFIFDSVSDYELEQV